MRGIIVKSFVVSLFVLALSIPAVQAVAAENAGGPVLKPELSGAPMGGGMGDMPSGHPALPQQPKGEMVSGKVLETMDAGKYTYVKVNVGGEEIWAAGLKTTVKVGDTVAFNKGMEMQQFRSESLKRTFDSIYFTDDLIVNGVKPQAAQGAAPGAPGANPHGTVSGSPESIDVSGIKPAEGGKTVKDIYEQKASLSGQEIVIRGKVVKSNPGVMGKNWFHLRDGTTAGDGHNDVTITSPDIAKVGDTVLVKGKVATDKDFGFGYRYDVMIEDAKVTKE